MPQKQTFEALDNFINNLGDASNLDGASFYDIYPWYFEQFSVKLKEEIFNNIILLGNSNSKFYLELVKSKINEAFIYNPNESLIEQWISRYNLVGNDFPFFENEPFFNIISKPAPSVFMSKNKEAKEKRLLQLDFFLHAVFIESEKIKQFIYDLLLDGHVTTKDSISDIVNPYPRIFKSYKAYMIFKNLLVEFGNTKQNLANYSFVFNRMRKDDLIHEDYQKTQFCYFLLDFDINIDRIKKDNLLGNLAYREGIYNRTKHST